MEKLSAFEIFKNFEGKHISRSGVGGLLIVLVLVVERGGEEKDSSIGRGSLAASTHHCP